MASSAIQTEKIYTDIPTDFSFHPIKKDLMIISNEEAVKTSIKNLLRTNYYERNDPLIGSNLESQLFELTGLPAQLVIEESIKTTIENHEDRCQIISVKVAVDPDRNQINATVTFSLISNPEPITLTTILTRVR
ncbi:hypothetical protein [Caulobacter phage Cr30]|uniref:hypothetical protein n=1 Tax=Caulobacter phage Cr30 TaxID=1357714 RepID=UPI0004A9B818|nr:hypothetical protein OZ74_gp246 [Caulobacter phage Cr30]AGS81097.1 hypothetical protein [Caulobacter phage Cr30]